VKGGSQVRRHFDRSTPLMTLTDVKTILHKIYKYMKKACPKPMGQATKTSTH
jgi:hypothetical protein